MTDDAALLTKWQFPQSSVLGPGDRIVVHASEQDLVDPNGVFHTNFKSVWEANFWPSSIRKATSQGNIVDSLSPAYPPQATNVAYGLEESLPGRVYSFTDMPTPGAENVPGFIGFAQPPAFSVPGGTFVSSDPLAVDLSTNLPGGEIRYTTDRSLPTETSTLYTAPIPISESTQVRAKVFHPGRVASEVAGETDVALDGDVVDVSSDLPIVVMENFGQRAPLDRIFRNGFEFIELTNTGALPGDLGELKFEQVEIAGGMQGIDFTFGSQALNPGEQIVVVNDRAAFESRYGNRVRIADGNDGAGGNNGEYGDLLANGGERITLTGDPGISILSFDYDDNSSWPQRTDGQGSSLELIDANLDPNDPTSWRNSVERGGSPGAMGIGAADSVIINEVLNNTPGPIEDAIELYNPTGEPIDIGGMWLSDTVDFLDRYVIPADTIVPAGGYLVLDQKDFGFGLNGTRGEAVVLVQPDALPWFIDHVTFGPASPLESFGRRPNGSGPLVPMNSVSLGSENSGPRTGPVVISEVMYNPRFDLDIGFDPQRLEFVEIYNSSSMTVDLTGWEVDGIGYQFTSGTAIGPGQNLVLVPFHPIEDASRVAAFEKAYDVDISANQSGYLGPYTGRLDNAGEPVTLRRAAEAPASSDPATFPWIVEDQLIYDNAAPWPAAANGTGISLQRSHVDLWAGDADSWIDGVPTPGRFGLVISAVLDGDDDADRQDVQRLVEELLGKRFGDGNLDQKIDVQDVNLVAANFDPLGPQPHNGWARGDFDGDGDVDIRDFNQLARNYAPLGYLSPGAPIATSIPIHQHYSRFEWVSPLVDGQ